MVGYLLVLLAAPTRESFFDGVRALLRYPELWIIPVLLSFCYTAWQVAVRIFFYFALSGPDRPHFAWWIFEGFPSEGWSGLVLRSLLPAAEGVAGLSIVFFTTYPASALAGVLLLMNWGGHCAVLRRALRNRFGMMGWLLWCAILVGAMAAVIKPFAYVALALGGRFSGIPLLRITLGIDWVSFLFEALLGIGLQIYLILLAYLWVRGRSFTHEHLMDVAIRRFSVVLRWVGPVMLVSSLLIHLPHFMLTFRGPVWMLNLATGELFDWLLRLFFVVLLLTFFAVEIILIFHSESLRAGWRDNFRFLFGHPMPLLFFLSMVFFHFLILQVLGQAAVGAFGKNSLPGIICQFLQAGLTALIGGWLLASWVCLYKRLEPGPPARLS